MTTDPDSPHVVASRLTEQEASTLIDHLREHGIEAQAWGTHLAAIYGQVAPRDCVEIVVRQSEVKRAKNVVEKFQRQQLSPPE